MSDEKSEIVWIKEGRNRWIVYVTRPEEKEEQARLAQWGALIANAYSGLGGPAMGSQLGYCPCCGRQYHTEPAWGVPALLGSLFG